MLLSLPDVHRLGRVVVPVRGPGKLPPRMKELERLRDRAVERLCAASGIDGLGIHPADVVLQPGAPGSGLWRASWSPSRILTELDGGPKDGARLSLPVLRAVITFRVLAPGWQAAAASGHPLPKLTYRYTVAGYDPGRAIYVHRYLEIQD